MTTVSVETGMGHFVRSYTLLSEFISHPQITSDDVCLCVDSKLNVDSFIKADLRNNIEFVSTCEVIEKINPDDTVVLDLLHLESQLFETIKSNSRKVISVSPVFNFNERVDILFLRGDSDFVQGNAQLVFKGHEYTVIRKGVPKLSAGVYESSLDTERVNIGVAMGATDPENYTLEIIRELSHLPKKVTLWVAVGSGYPHDINKLIETASRTDGCEIIIANVTDSLWSLLSFCSLLVLQGGLTTSEACYAGIPSINIPRFGTQTSLMRKFIDNDLIWFLEKDKLGKLQDFVMNLISDKFLLMNTHLKLKSFQDGLGARRIVDSILEHQAKKTALIAQSFSL